MGEPARVPLNRGEHRSSDFRQRKVRRGKAPLSSSLDDWTTGRLDDSRSRVAAMGEPGGVPLNIGDHRSSDFRHRKVRRGNAALVLAAQRRLGPAAAAGTNC